jgi:hypothetical protein
MIDFFSFSIQLRKKRKKNIDENKLNEKEKRILILNILYRFLPQGYFSLHLIYTI